MSKYISNYGRYSINTIATITGLSETSIQKRKERGEFNIQNFESVSCFVSGILLLQRAKSIGKKE